MIDIQTENPLTCPECEGPAVQLLDPRLQDLAITSSPNVPLPVPPGDPEFWISVCANQHFWNVPPETELP
jgi:hypothetical protein